MLLSANLPLNFYHIPDYSGPDFSRFSRQSVYTFIQKYNHNNHIQIIKFAITVLKLTRRLNRCCFVESEYLRPCGAIHRVALRKDWKNRRVGVNEPQSHISWWTKYTIVSPYCREVYIVW